MVNSITRLKHHIQRVLPQVYSDALSHSELLELVINKVNEVIDMSNEYFEKDLKAYTSEILLEWKNDGTLDTVINESVFSDLDSRLKQNDSELNRLYGLGDAGVHFYVNSISGSDLEGDGTIEKPYRTIQYTFNQIPKVIDKRHTVNIAPGLYNEEAFLTGIIGGSVYVQTYGITPPDVGTDIAVRVNSLSFYDMMGYVNVADVGPSDETANISRDSFLLFSRCIYGSVGKIRVDKDLKNVFKYAVQFDGTIGSVKTSHFENQHVAVLSIRGGNVRIDPNCTLVNSNYGLFAQSGLIWKHGDVSWHNTAVTPEREHEGGRIYGQNQYTWRDVSYKNSWVTASGVPLRFKREGSIGILYGWVGKSAIDTTIIGTLPDGYLPVNTQRFLVTAGGTSSKQSATLNIASNGDINLLNTGDITTNTVVISVMFPLA